MGRQKNILLFFFLIFLSSCFVDQIPNSSSANFCPGNREASGDCPTPTKTWSFTDSSDYTYDSNFIEVSDGKVRLKDIDTSFSGTDFSSGTHSGSILTNEKLSILADKTNSSLKASSILSELNTNIVAYWTFDGSFADSSSFDRQGEATGDASIATESHIGSGSMVTDGDLDIYSVTDRQGLSGMSELAISLWFKVDSYVGGDTLVAYGTNASRIYMITFSSTDITTTINTDTGYSGLNAGTAPNLNLWNHLVLNYTGTNHELYLNGVMLDSDSITGKIIEENDSSQRFRLGRNWNTSQGLDGNMDEVMVLNKSLTAKQIADLYFKQSKNYTQLNSSWTPHWDDIVGYWKMDGNWKDSSGKNNHGIAGGDITFTTSSKIGSSAAALDGVGDYVLVDDDDVFDDTTKLSISFWFHPLELDGIEGIVSKRVNFDDQHSFGVFTYTGKKIFIDIDGTNDRFTTNTSFQTNRWYHVLVVYDGDKVQSERVRVYVDGKLDRVGGETSSKIPNYNSPLNIGKQSNGTFEGKIDEVAIWKNVALDSSQVLTIYNRQKQKYASSYESPVVNLGSSQKVQSLSVKTELPYLKGLSLANESATNYSSIEGSLGNELVGYWNLNESSLNSVGGYDFNDSSINSHHGNEQGGVKIGKSGILGNSAVFDGVNDYVDLGSFSALTLEYISVSAWVKFNSTGIEQQIFSNDNSNAGRYWQLRRNNDGSILFVVFNRSGGNNNATGPLNTELGKWYHITGTWDGENIRVYINAKPGAPTAFSGQLNSPQAGTAYIGRSENTSPGYLKGNVDEVSFWGRALSTSEIVELYRRGANRIKYQVRKCLDSTCSSNPEWKGPGGDGTTYFSELYNRSSSDLNSIFSGCYSASPDVCDSSEFSLSGSTQAGAMKSSFSDFPIFNEGNLNAQYFQYRVFMEAEENSACDDQACLPSLTSLSFETEKTYYDTSPSLKSSNPITISNSIQKVEETVRGDCNIKYQFSKDGSNFYYLTSGSWELASNNVSQANSVSEISTSLKNFISSGSLYFRAYFVSNGSQSCQLEKLSVSQ